MSNQWGGSWGSDWNPANGHGPIPTCPLYCTDELIAIQAPADFANLVDRSQIDAQGQDGVFDADAPWVLNSASVDFQAQGVQAQGVIRLAGPKNVFQGGGQQFAIDSVSGNSATLRRLGKALNLGQPPAPTAGLSGVSFEVLTFYSQIDQATYRIKDRFGIDETIWTRASQWIYQGAEARFRCLRDAVVFTVLLDAYEQGNRSEQGDWAAKTRIIRGRLADSLEQVRIRWGQYGNSQSPTGPTSGMLCR